MLADWSAAVGAPRHRPARHRRPPPTPSTAPKSIRRDTQTGFGDNTLDTCDTADGSELDGLYIYIDDCTLYLVAAGNIHDYNKLELFFDTPRGWLSAAPSRPPPVGLGPNGR